MLEPTQSEQPRALEVGVVRVRRGERDEARAADSAGSVYLRGDPMARDVHAVHVAERTSRQEQPIVRIVPCTADGVCDAPDDVRLHERQHGGDLIRVNARINGGRDPIAHDGREVGALVQLVEKLE